MAVPSSPAKSSAVEDPKLEGSESKIRKSKDPKKSESKSMEKVKLKELKMKVEKSSVVNGSGGGGIYEGKTCHQCRQKIVVPAVGCKNTKKDKPCPMKFCCKCLLNRYGETAAEKEAIDDWKCPKCRGICNCSSCMKKRGLPPTGQLAHTAKENGFPSVSQMLDAKGVEACKQLSAKKKRATPAEGPVLVGNCDANLNSQPPLSSVDESRVNKPSLERLKDSDAEVMGNAVTEESQKQKAKIKPHKLGAFMNDHVVDVVLPPGTLLASVSGIDLLPEDVGDALQFMEFCAAFGEVLDIRKGQPESVLRDIMSERGRRKGKYSSAVQFLIQLLSFILKGEEGSVPSSPDSDKDSWLSLLKKCISESDCAVKDVPKDCFDRGHDGYEMLEPSQKLKLLTFLCDEALCTIEARDWIEKQHFKFAEKLKEAREALNAAKEKEKLLKLKLQDETSKEVAQNGDLQANNSELNSTGEVKGEIDQAQEEIMKAMESLPKKRRSDALRTEPIFLDDKGRVFWRLNCLSDSDLLLQDLVDPCYQSVSSENWFTYDAKEAKKIKRHISKARRSKRRRFDKLNDPLMMNTNSDIEPDSSSNDDTPNVNDN